MTSRIQVIPLFIFSTFYSDRKLSKSIFEKFPSKLKPFTLALAKGDCLFEQGKGVVNLYLINSGRVKLIRNTIDGTPLIAHTSERGETIAEASLFTEHYHCSAIADVPTNVSFVKKKELLQHLDNNPLEMKKLLAVLARQVRDLRTINEIKNIRSAKERILAYIRSNIDNNNEMVLELSLKDTAHKIGLAHETFYREIKKLEESTVIIRKGNHIKLILLSK